MQKLLFLAPAVLLTGCAYFSHHNAKPMSEHQQVCSQLKREITMLQTDANSEAQWSTSAKRAKLYKEYHQYQCDGPQDK